MSKSSRYDKFLFKCILFYISFNDFTVLIAECRPGSRDMEFKNLQIIIYSREPGADGPIIVATDIEDVNLVDKKNTNFNHKIPTRVIIGGFMSDRIKLFSIKNEYFQGYNYNVVIVTWKNNVDLINNIGGENLIQMGGTAVYRLLDNITDLRQSLNNIYLIGHGIGAHIAGYAGMLIHKKYFNKINRIYAIDPKYENTGEESLNRRLNIDDANYVENILTTYTYSNSGPLPVGHADYIINDYFQMPCADNNLDLDLKVFMLSSCAHNIALDYFAESINSNTGFWGLRKNKGICENCEHFSKMGDKKRIEFDSVEDGEKQFGLFLLTTNVVSPYARGMNIIQHISPRDKLIALGLKP